MTITTVYRHGDYPVAIGGTFAKRVQDVSLDKNTPTTPRSELGNFQPVGLMQEPTRYTGEISWFPIDNQIECLLAGYAVTGSPVSLKTLYNANAVDIRTVKTAMGGCKVTSLGYDVTAEGDFRATVGFDGTSWAAGSAIVATTPSGAACYSGKDVLVTVNSVTGVRMAGISIKANFNGTQIFELNNSSPVGTVYDSPSVTCDIDFLESDSMAANTELTLAAPADIIVTVNGASTKRITLKNMTSGPGVQGNKGTVNGNATRRYSYISKSDADNYGLLVDNA